jgi:hypothetical protein
MNTSFRLYEDGAVPITTDETGKMQIVTIDFDSSRRQFAASVQQHSEIGRGSNP